MNTTKVGKIYKIIHNQSNDIYIGSTMDSLKYRWQGHKLAYTKYINNNYSPNTIYTNFLKYGIENFKMVLIKEYQVIDRKHLLALETLWQNKLNPINKRPAFQPLTKQKNKISNKIYREKNMINFKCECGGFISNKQHLNRHKQSNKHIQYTSLNNL